MPNRKSNHAERVSTVSRRKGAVSETLADLASDQMPAPRDDVARPASEVFSTDAVRRWLPLSGAVAWVLTRDEAFTDRAISMPAKCFVEDHIVYAETEDGNCVPDLYFDNAEAAWNYLHKEIANKKIKTKPPVRWVKGDEDWLTNSSVQIGYAELQSVFPRNGLELLTSKLIGPPIRPSDVPDLSLTEAAHWIATKGGSVECVISDAEVWKQAFAELIKKNVNDDVALLGRRRGTGLHEKIPGEALVGIRIDHPYQICFELVFSDEPYLECYGVGSSDSLFFGRQQQWSNLRLKGAEIDRHWPFRKRSKGGRKETYDGEQLRKDSVSEVKSNGSFPSEEAYKKWCSGAMKIKPGRTPPKGKIEGDEPDPHTVDAFIKRNKLLEIPDLIAAH